MPIVFTFPLERKGDVAAINLSQLQDEATILNGTKKNGKSRLKRACVLSQRILHTPLDIVIDDLGILEAYPSYPSSYSQGIRTRVSRPSSWRVLYGPRTHHVVSGRLSQGVVNWSHRMDRWLSPDRSLVRSW